MPAQLTHSRRVVVNWTTSGRLESFLRSRRGKLGILILVLLTAYETAETIVDGDLTKIWVVGIASVLIAICVAILQDWRRGVYCFLAWIMVEDLARKYLGNNMILYFAKDALAAIVYLSFFVSRRVHRSKIFRPPFWITLLVFFWYCLLQVFNPAASSVFFGLMGMKMCFFYVPMLFLGYVLIDSEAALRRFFFFNCTLVLIVAGLGLAQSILGHTFLNPTVIQEDIRGLSTNYRTSPITGLIAYRPTSVFVSAGRFQNFLIVSWVVTLGFGGFLLMRRQSGRVVGFLTIGVLFTACMMTASRGVFLWTLANAVVLGLAFLWGAIRSPEHRVRIVRAIHRAAVFAGIALVVLVSIFPDQVSSRVAIYSETLSPDSPRSELTYRSWDYPLVNLAIAFDYPRWPYGYGLGTASLGVQYVTRIFHARPMNIGVENGWGQLVLELGIVGLLLWIWLTFTITRSAWRAVKSLKETTWFPIAFAIFWYGFIVLFPLSFYGFIAYEDFVLNAYLWILLGMLFRLAKLPKVATVSPVVSSTPS